MENILRPINNIAVSVFAVIVGFKMWFSMQGNSVFIALVVILIGVSALESNIISILNDRRSNEAEKARR
jgi:hypothetical protein